jgi:hypothetical protein
MAKLIHEIWETVDDKVRTSGLCLAGPDGDQFRELLHAEAGSNADGAAPKLLRSFEADSHFEAMTIYYQHYGWDEHKTDFSEDREPYPEEWAKRQRLRTN